MSKPVLTYFNGRGRAEVTRLLFAEAKVDYVDNRVQDLSELKKSGKLPFGQVPILEIDGVVLPQSLSFARYVAKKYGFYPKNELEQATVDALLDGVSDVAMRRYMAKTDEEKQKFKSETIPVWFGYFENYLTKNSGSEYFVGKNLTVADFAIFNMVNDLCLAFGQDILNSFPHLKAHYHRIENRPNIAAWLKSRPQTPF